MSIATQSIIQSGDLLSLKNIIDKIPVAILIINAQGIFVDCNKKTITLFRASSQKEILGSSPDLLSPLLQRDGQESKIMIRGLVEQAFMKGTLSFYWEHIRLDREVFPAQVTLSSGEYEGEPCLIASVIDITGQIRMEENEALIQANPYALLVLNPDLSVADVNPAFLDISGYHREEWIGRNLKEFNIIKRDGPTVNEAIEAKKTVSGKIITSFPTGIRHMEYSYIPVFDSNQNLIKIYDIFSDLTGLIEKVTESETLVSESPTSIITIDLKGNILSCNKSFLDLTMIPKSHILTLNLRDFNIISREGDGLSEVISMKKPGKGKMIVDFGDRLKDLEYTYIPILDMDENIQKVISLYVDQTEQNTYIEEIRTFISNNPYAIFTLNLSHQIIDVNPAFSKLSGYSNEQLLKMNLRDFKVIERKGHGVEEAIQTKQPTKGKIVVQFPVGIRYMDYSYIPVLDARGNVSNIIEVFADQTPMVEKIRESDTLVKENPSCIFSTDLKGNILSANQSFIDVVQIPESKLLTMNLQDFKVIERSGSSLDDVLITKNPGRGNLTLDLGKRTKIFDYVYIPVLDASDNVTHMVMMYTDMTTIRKMVLYLEQSINGLYGYISNLSLGKCDFSTTVLEAEPEIIQAKEQFVRITMAVDTARDSISRLVHDSTSIATAALAGELSFRIDPKNHEGDYREVIEGMNQTLDSFEIPVREAMRISKEFSEYNFKERFDSRMKVKGDWVAFRSALDEIGNKISSAILTINSQVMQLSVNTDEANNNVAEITEGAALMAKNATQVSSNAEQGNFSIQQILKAMEDLTVTVGDVSRKTEEVSEFTSNTNNLAGEGTALAKKAENGMQVITVSANDMNRLINEIQQDMSQIGKIVNLISDIASQTNLLALNAAIEAARAGEAGRGFAVVAAEVKALALESRQSAENIAEMIGSLQKKSEDAGKSSMVAAGAIQDGNIALNETLQVFTKLAESVEGIAIHIEQVAAMSEEQASTVEEITASVNEISTLLEENSKEAVNIAGISEESASSLDELKTIIHQVYSGTNEVSGAVSHFIV